LQLLQVGLLFGVGQVIRALEWCLIPGGGCRIAICSCGGQQVTDDNFGKYFLSCVLIRCIDYKIGIGLSRSTSR
jgi:hypothetical protein